MLVYSRSFTVSLDEKTSIWLEYLMETVVEASLAFNNLIWTA